jgi:hypothetical protein
MLFTLLMMINDLDDIEFNLEGLLDAQDGLRGEVVIEENDIESIRIGRGLEMLDESIETEELSG